MLERAFAAGVPARWVVGACIDGAEDLRRRLEAAGQAYVLAVTAPHTLWKKGEQRTVAELVERHPELGWVRLSAGEGSQGPRRYDWAWIRLPYPSAPGMARWLLIRRAPSLPEEYAYYRVYGPETTALPPVRPHIQRYLAWLEAELSDLERTLSQPSIGGCVPRANPRRWR
jgi:hypothetical protein